MELYCEYCGKPLPPNCSPRRKYHKDCAIIVNSKKTYKNQLDKKRNYVDSFKTKTDKKDVEYCKPCIYHNTHSWNYLCNYYIMTGSRRGCKAGVGCNKRKTK